MVKHIHADRLPVIDKIIKNGSTFMQKYGVHIGDEFRILNIDNLAKKVGRDTSFTYWWYNFIKKY